MANSPDLVAHCAELLASAGTVRVNRMFGGHGFYVDELFVAILASEQLFLKTDADGRARFEAEGCVPFRYSAKDREEVSLSYFSAPADAMESPALMAPWVRLAVQAALKSRAAKVPRSRTSATTRRPAPSAAKKAAGRA